MYYGVSITTVFKKKQLLYKLEIIRIASKKTKRQEFGDFRKVGSSKRTKRGVKIVVRKIM